MGSLMRMLEDEQSWKLEHERARSQYDALFGFDEITEWAREQEMLDWPSLKDVHFVIEYEDTGVVSGMLRFSTFHRRICDKFDIDVTQMAATPFRKGKLCISFGVFELNCVIFVQGFGTRFVLDLVDVAKKIGRRVFMENVMHTRIAQAFKQSLIDKHGFMLCGAMEGDRGDWSLLSPIITPIVRELKLLRARFRRECRRIELAPGYVLDSASYWVQLVCNGELEDDVCMLIFMQLQ